MTLSKSRSLRKYLATAFVACGATASCAALLAAPADAVRDSHGRLPARAEQGNALAPAANVVAPAPNVQNAQVAVTAAGEVIIADAARHRILLVRGNVVTQLPPAPAPVPANDPMDLDEAAGSPQGH